MILLDWIIFNSAISHHLSISCFFQTLGEEIKPLAALWHLALLKHSCSLEWSVKGKFCRCGWAELERNLRPCIEPGSHYLNSAFLAVTVYIYSRRTKKAWRYEKGWWSHQYEQTLLFWCTSHLYVSPALPGAAFSGICCSPIGSCTRFLVPWGPVFNPRSWDHGFSIRTSVLVSLLVLVRAGMTNWIKGQEDRKSVV